MELRYNHEERIITVLFTTGDELALAHDFLSQSQNGSCINMRNWFPPVWLVTGYDEPSAKWPHTEWPLRGGVELPLSVNTDEEWNLVGKIRKSLFLHVYELYFGHILRATEKEGILLGFTIDVKLVWKRQGNRHDVL